MMDLLPNIWKPFRVSDHQRVFIEPNEKATIKTVGWWIFLVGSVEFM
jgi:hypothetical protein